jgi:predicted outer membrane protein
MATTRHLIVTFIGGVTLAAAAQIARAAPPDPPPEAPRSGMDLKLERTLPKDGTLGAGSIHELDEAELLSRIHADNERALRIARLAAARSQSPEVKSFAKDVLEDRTLEDKRTVERAGDLGLKLGNVVSINEEDREQMNRIEADEHALETEKSAKFDRMYLELITRADKHLVDVVTANRKHVKNELRPFLDSFIALIGSHKDSATKLIDKIGRGHGAS